MTRVVILTDAELRHNYVRMVIAATPGVTVLLRPDGHCRDFTVEAIRTLYRRFNEGLVEHCLVTEAARCRKASLVVNPALAAEGNAV